MKTVSELLTITVSDVKQFAYCPRVVYFTYPAQAYHL